MPLHIVLYPCAAALAFQICRCLERTYIIHEDSIGDITQLLRQLSIVRALLTVQMDSDEEEIMIGCLK